MSRERVFSEPETNVNPDSAVMVTSEVKSRHEVMSMMKRVIPEVVRSMSQMN